MDVCCICLFIGFGENDIIQCYNCVIHDDKKIFLDNKPKQFNKNTYKTVSNLFIILILSMQKSKDKDGLKMGGYLFQTLRKSTEETTTEVEVGW